MRREREEICIAHKIVIYYSIKKNIKYGRRWGYIKMESLEEIWKNYIEPIAVEIAVEVVTKNNMRKDDINEIVQECALNFLERARRNNNVLDIEANTIRFKRIAKNYSKKVNYRNKTEVRLGQANGISVTIFN